MSSGTDASWPMLRRPECRMLVIDDEIHILASVAEYFSMLGYQVDSAPDESTAFALLERFRYEAVITDLRLSAMNRLEGLDIVSCIRSRQPDCACVVLTGHGDPENEQEARRRGADAFLQKPTPLCSLAVLIIELLDRRPAFGLAEKETDK